MELLFYDKNSIKNLNIDYPDIYFTPEYGEICEYSDDGIWECCLYNDLIYVYLKKKIIYNNQIYFYLLSPYGYSGFYYKTKKTYDEFIIMFRIEAKKRNYVYEILRQNPYIKIEITDYEIIKQKKLYAININNFDSYYKLMTTKKRNMYNKGLKQMYIFEIKKKFDDNFIEIYNKKMNLLKANKYYYFNDNYFKNLNNLNETYVANVKNNNELIGSTIFFKYKNFIHYHLSANNNSSNCINDYLIFNLVKENENKTIILGCGITNNDTLDRYKNSISNVNYDYIIYRNIINNDIFQKINI